MSGVEWRACCKAGADRNIGTYVHTKTQLPVEEAQLIPSPASKPYAPSRYTALHEASHAYFLHGAGYKISEARVGARNYVRRAIGVGDQMLDFEQVIVSIAGDIGATLASGEWLRNHTGADDSIARVRTGCHGTCDDCAAAYFCIKLAGPEAPSEVPVEIWRLAEAKATELLTEAPAFAAINRLADALLEAGHMEGAAVHALLETLLPFGAWQPADAA